MYVGDVIRVKFDREEMIFSLRESAPAALRELFCSAFRVICILGVPRFRAVSPGTHGEEFAAASCAGRCWCDYIWIMLWLSSVRTRKDGPNVKWICRSEMARFGGMCVENVIWPNFEPSELWNKYIAWSVKKEICKCASTWIFVFVNCMSTVSAFHGEYTVYCIENEPWILLKRIEICTLKY